MRIKKDALWAAGLFLSLSTLYLLTLDFDYSHDTDLMRLAMDVEGKCTGISYPFFHPAWVPLGKAVWHFWRLLGYAAPSFIPLHVFSALTGSLTMAAFFLLLLRITDNRLLSLFMTLCLSTSAFWWRISVEFRPYAPGVLLSFITFWLLLFCKADKKLPLIFGGFLSALMALVHLAFGFFFPAACLAILLRNTTFKTKLLNLSLYLTTLILSFLLGLFLIDRDVLTFYGNLMMCLSSLVGRACAPEVLLHRTKPLSILSAYLWGMGTTDNRLFIIYQCFTASLFAAVVVAVLVRFKSMVKEPEQRAVFITTLFWLGVELYVGLYVLPGHAPRVIIFFLLFILIGYLLRPIQKKFWKTVFSLFFFLLFLSVLSQVLFSPFSRRISRSTDPYWPVASLFISKAGMTEKSVLICPYEFLGSHITYLKGCLLLLTSSSEEWTPSGLKMINSLEERVRDLLSRGRKAFFVESSPYVQNFKKNKESTKALLMTCFDVALIAESPGGEKCYKVGFKQKGK